MAGRRSKSKTEKDLTDTRAAHAPVVDFEAEAPPMPDYIRDDSRLAAVWSEVVKEFSRIKILAKTDTSTIEGYVILLEKLRRVTRFLSENGETYEARTANGTRIYKRPECDFQKEALLRLKMYATELGATPASRPNVPRGLGADLFSHADNKSKTNSFAELDRLH